MITIINNKKWEEIKHICFGQTNNVENAWKRVSHNTIKPMKIRIVFWHTHTQHLHSYANICYSSIGDHSLSINAVTFSVSIARYSARLAHISRATTTKNNWPLGQTSANIQRVKVNAMTSERIIQINFVHSRVCAMCAMCEWGDLCSWCGWPGV